MAISSKSYVCLVLFLGIFSVSIYGKSLVEQELATTTVPDSQTEVVMMDLMEDEDSEVNWNQELTLNKMGDVQLKISSEDPAWLTMEMKGPGKGYISIGFSPDGGMNNSDIIMGWIDAEGKAQLKDLHGVGNTKPKEDPKQNYELISGEQTDSETIIRFRRRWANGDAIHDKALETGDYKIIWAYNEEDPKLSDEDGVFRPPYHFTNRGVKDVKLEVPESERAALMMDSVMEDTKSEVNWNQEVTLNKMGDVQLKISSEDPAWLTMEMKGPGKGYISIGFSPDGGMNNSDIVMGWIDAEGKAQLKDLHGVGNTKPKEDPKQNYELISGEQTDSETIIRFRRRWANCDATHDRALETGDYKIIWAYNAEDPKLSDEDGVFRPPYHFTNRGVKDVKIEGPTGDLEKNCE